MIATCNGRHGAACNIRPGGFGEGELTARLLLRLSVMLSEFFAVLKLKSRQPRTLNCQRPWASIGPRPLEGDSRPEVFLCV